MIRTTSISVPGHEDPISVVEAIDPTDGYKARFVGRYADLVTRLVQGRPGERISALASLFAEDGDQVASCARVVVAVGEDGTTLDVDIQCDYLSNPIIAPIE